jgi:hypothetical protein
VLVHREEILQQIAAAFRAQYPHLTVHIERGGELSDPSEADFTIASVHTLGRLNTPKLQKLKRWAGLVIVDEVNDQLLPNGLNGLMSFSSGSKFDTQCYRELTLPVILGV